MMSRWRWVLTLFSRRLWLRVTIMALAGVAAAAAGIILGPYLSEAWTIKIGAQAIDGILNVLASSMLAVTVFSVSTMVAAYGAASSNVTPRATRLLLEDNTSQNVLGTFVGSFLFSLVGIISLSTGLYGSQGRAFLLVATVGLIALVAATILRWIDYLARFGRLDETVERVEQATRHAMESRLAHPHLGGRPLEHRDSHSWSDARPVFSSVIGYVQHIDVGALQRVAEEREGEIIVTALPGAFADPSRPLAMIRGDHGKDVEGPIEKAFTIGTERNFDQDPRFGLCVLAEIASRALSPGINDPGTAIDVIGRALRLLVLWGNCRPPDEPAAEFPRVWVPAIGVHDLLDDIFGPIARDGCRLLEVQIRLQKALFALLVGGGRAFADPAARHSRLALMRAEAGLALEQEREVIRRLAEANHRRWLDATSGQPRDCSALVGDEGEAGPPWRQ